MTAPGPRDPQAEQDHAEFTRWMDAQGYVDPLGIVSEAFLAGLQVQRELDAATLAAEVRAGHVRIETRPAPERLAASDRIVRDILESLCRRDGLSLESTVVPGEPARNYALAERLGIGHVFGLPDAPQPAPGHVMVMRGTIALRDAEIDLLNARVADLAGPCPGCESLRRQCSELAGEVGMLAGALTEIRDTYPPGHAGHDNAHAALDCLHGFTPPPEPGGPEKP